MERSDTDLCTMMLRNKYLKENDFFGSNVRGGLSFGNACRMLSSFVRVDSSM
jgi:hypothetical protein